MSHRHTGRGGRSAARQILLLLVLLPVLIVGPALGGMAAWLHSHGPSGEHLHLLAGESEHAEVGTFHAWHEAQHRHGDDGDTHREDGPAPGGLRIELPEILAAPLGGRTSSSIAGLELPALPHSPRWHTALLESPHGPELRRSGWPPQAARRSGIAGLLRSSHAILI